MIDFNQIQEFLKPVSKAVLNEDEVYDDLQIGQIIDLYEEGHIPNLDAVSLVFLGVPEMRGGAIPNNTATLGPDIIRKQFYRLYHWHQDMPLADLGNIVLGRSLADTYAAVKIVVSSLIQAGKTVVILGGSHDLTYAQYQAYASQKWIIEASVADAKMDLHAQSELRTDRFLLDIFMEQPNFLRHYNHMGFQSYFVQPTMLETLDKLRFDCYRLGKVQENIEEMEPVLRESDMFSIDIQMIRHIEAPVNRLSPNGFTGAEACALAKYAGMSSKMSSFGIYGYQPEKDTHELTAVQIAQMLWYYLDGQSVKYKEASLSDKEAFVEFHVALSDYQISFMKSKKTARWWMQLPDQKYVACSYQDYVRSSNDELPERWLRNQERLI